MNFIKKSAIPLAILTAALAGMAIYLFVFSGNDTFDAIPKSAIAVLKVKDWSQFNEKLSTTTTGAELKKTAAIQKLQDEIDIIQTLLHIDKSLSKAISSGQTIASLHLTSASEFDFLYTIELSGVNDNTILNRVQSSPQLKTVKVRIFKNNKVVDVALRNGKELSFCKLNNILAFSFAPFLIENSITCVLNGENLNNDKNFQSIKGKLELSDLNLYINFSKTDIILPVALISGKSPLLSDLKEYAIWGRYQVNFTNDQIELNGTAVTYNVKQKPDANNTSENLLFRNIPDNASFVNVSLINIDQVKNTGSVNIAEKYFSNWLLPAKAFAVIEPLNENYISQNVFIATISDKNAALRGLKNFIAADGGNPIAIDTFRDSEIFSLRNGGVINQLYPNSLVSFNNCFVAVTKEVALFCNNSDVLKLSLEKISNGETLIKDKTFLNAGKGALISNTGVLYINTQRSDYLLKHLIPENSSLHKFVKSFNTILTFSTFEENKINSHVFLKAGEANNPTAEILWKTKLLSGSNFTPQLITNKQKNDREIFVQDTDNTVYLVNQSGQILFSKNVEAPVLGEVQQIDYYNNNTFQLVFNTASFVYILDKAGNDIASYPLRLSSKASAGLTLVTDVSKKTASIFVPCINGNIYGYEANGKPLAGWSPRSGLGVCNYSLQALSLRTNNFLLSFSENGIATLLDIKGNTKWSISNLYTGGNCPAIAQWSNDFKVIHASANQLTEISSDGNDKIIPLIDSVYSFTVNVSSDSAFTYYAANRNQIRSYNNKHAFTASANLNQTHISHISTIDIFGKKYLRIRDEGKNETLLFSSDLKPLVQFSASPKSKFLLTDLLNRGEFTAISVDMEGSLTCQRIKR